MSESIPKDWGKRDFKKVVYFQEGPGLLSSQFRDNGIPFLNIRCLDGKGVIKENLQYLDENEVLTKYNHFLLDDKDLVVSSSGTLGRCAFIKKEDLPLMLNTSIIRMRPLNDDLDRKFLKYYLESSDFQKAVYRMSTGSAQNNYGPSHLSKIRFLLPKSLKEQQKIASILENVDNNIDKTHEIIQKYGMMKQGLMHDFFTDIGKEYWVNTSLGNKEYFSLATGGTPSTEIQGYWGGNICWMVSGDVHKKTIFDVEGRITQEGYNNSNARIIPKNSILIALAGQGKTRGTVAINKIELTLNQSVAAIISKIDKIDPYYIFYYLENQYEQLRASSAGAGRAGLSLKILSNYDISFPDDLNQQKEISGVLISIDNKLNSEKKYLDKLQKIKTGLMQDLLTGKVRVKT